MAADAKYGAVTVEVDSSRNPLNGTDEPVFLLRAQDRAAVSAVRTYRACKWNDRNAATEKAGALRVRCPECKGGKVETQTLGGRGEVVSTAAADCEACSGRGWSVPEADSEAYAGLVEESVAAGAMVDAVDEVLATVEAWREANPGRVKVSD